MLLSSKFAPQPMRECITDTATGLFHRLWPRDCFPQFLRAHAFGTGRATEGNVARSWSTVGLWVNRELTPMGFMVMIYVPWWLYMYHVNPIKHPSLFNMPQSNIVITCFTGCFTSTFGSLASMIQPRQSQPSWRRVNWNWLEWSRCPISP
jgi:hypothetical protein